MRASISSEDSHLSSDYFFEATAFRTFLIVARYFFFLRVTVFFTTSTTPATSSTIVFINLFFLADFFFAVFFAAFFFAMTGSFEGKKSTIDRGDDFRLCGLTFQQARRLARQRSHPSVDAQDVCHRVER
jgi:hypothetical protein